MNVLVFQIPDLEICADNQSEPEPKIVESVRDAAWSIYN